MKLLLWRNRQGVKRHPGHGRIKIGQTIFIGLLCLALFHDQYDYSEARSLIASLFFICVNQTMMNMMGTILTFQEERPVFLREQANKMYKVSPYYMAKILIEAPLFAFTPMLFTVIVYFKIGLTITASQFFTFYLILLLIVNCAASFGYFMSSIFNKEEMATALAPVIMMPIILFGGQFSNSATIMAWIRWFQYLSPIRYAMEAMVRNEFDNRNYNSTMLLKDYYSGATTIYDINQNHTAVNITQYKVVQYPESNPVDSAGWDLELWRCLVVLAGLTVALRLLSLIFLKLMVSKFQ